jgi:hypothetical protein
MTLLNGPSDDQARPPLEKSDLARRFRTAWAEAPDQGTAIPELLPVRLARACVQVLPVAGAGLSLLNDEFRVPVGASDETATCAERLQFTQGEGPCLDAARSGRTVIADASQIQAQWPLFGADFLARTPYRGTISIPLRLSAETTGALDLYVTDVKDLERISITDAVAITDQIIDALTIAQAITASAGLWSDEPEPLWLQSGAVRSRTNVWVAIGMLMTRLDTTAPNALAMLRGYSYSHDTVLDEVADALAKGRLDIEQVQS